MDLLKREYERSPRILRGITLLALSLVLSAIALNFTQWFVLAPGSISKIDPMVSEAIERCKPKCLTEPDDPLIIQNPLLSQKWSAAKRAASLQPGN
jgi:hypothetical protein